MGHLTSRDAYKNLEDRLNWFTQGAPSSETLTKILSVLFTEKEAKWVAKLPIRPFSLKKAAQLWGTSEAKAEKLLDHLCEKGLLVDSYDHGVRKFVLPPPMIGFFEFSLMRTRGDIDQKYLSELFYQYINVEEDFIKDLFLGKGELCGGDATLVLSHKVDCLKPDDKRGMAAVHECASGHRSLVMAVNALVQSVVQFSVTFAPTLGAYKTVRPAVPCQSVSAVLLGGILRQSPKFCVNIK